MRCVLVLAGVTLLLTACGQDAASSTQEKPAYVSASLTVCEAAKKDADALVAPGGAADFKPFVDSSLAIAQRAQVGLAALTPPADDRDQLEIKVLKPFADLVAEGEAYAAKVTAAGTDQVKLLTLLAERPRPDGVDLEYLRSYGLGVCADVIDR